MNFAWFQTFIYLGKIKIDFILYAAKIFEFKT